MVAKLKITEKTDDKLIFELSGVGTKFANALRRVMMSEIPIWAIEEVNFTKNDSAIYDEFLANRLGLIPLKTTLTEINKPKGEPKIYLSKTGPCTVYSKDMKGDIKPTSDKIIIGKLNENQDLEFEAVAKLGTGKMNAKWAAAIIKYNYEGEGDKRVFKFEVESNGQLKAVDILKAGLGILKEKTEEFEKVAAKLK